MAGRYLKRKKRNFGAPLLLVVLASLLIFGIVFLRGKLKASEETVPPTESIAQAVQTTPPTTEAEQTQPTEVAVTEETMEETTEIPVMPQQPAFLTSLLDSNNLSYEELEQKCCSQLVTVSSSGTTAQIRFFSCQEDTWEELAELSCQGCVGYNGVCAEKQEGDGCTPSGLYGIGNAFYISNLPDTKLDAFQITEDTYWVDDPNSVFYNQRIEGTQNKDWNSAEHMISYGVYRYGFVVDYNLMAEKNAGSAIFFHVGNNPTAGCVATGEDMVLAYLKELDKERNPHILIFNSDDT